MQKATKNGFREIIPNFEGMDGLTDPSKLNEVQLALLENYTLKSYGNVGSLVSRNGFTRYNTNQIASGGSGVGSMYETTLNGTDYLLANIINSSSSALYYRTSPYTASFSTIKTDATLAYKLNYATFLNRVYMANVGGGASPNAVWDGTNYLDMGCPPPKIGGMTLTASAGGNLSAGAYRYLITYLYDGNQESSAFAYRDTSGGNVFNPRVVASLNDKVTLASIPTGNARVTARKIYRTTAGASSSSPYYYLTTIDDNTTTSYVDVMADTGLILPFDADRLARVPDYPFYSKYIVTHKERNVLGYLKDDFYNAISSSDITIADSGSGGSLTGSTTYKYRFFKCWNTNPVGAVTLGEYVEKTHTTGVGVTSVDITFSGTATWFGVIAIQRTSGGGSDFKFIGNAGRWGIDVTQLATGYNDGLSDSLRDGGSALQTDYGQGSSSLPNNIKISDAGKPDLFSNIETAQDGTLIPAGNEWNVGEPITGIHSEENRIVIFGNKNIYELDTTAQSRQFWRLNKIISGIGADDGLQCQVNGGYVFVQSGKRTDQDETVETFYYWDGRSKPVSINDSIITYLWDNGISEYLDLQFDAVNNLVWIIATNTGSTITYIFIYNLDTNQWEIYTNGTDLNFQVMCNSKNFGILIGGGDGYIHRQKESQCQDVIAGSNRTFTTKLRTKTWELYDTDLRPRRLRADISTTGAVTPVLKTAVDGTLNSGDNMTALASGFNRPIQQIFTNATGTSYRQVYFQLEMTANVQQKVHGLMIDFTTDHEDSGGR